MTRFSRFSLTRYLTVACLAFLASSSAWAQAGGELSAAARSILDKKCLVCHGATQMSGLDLRQREAMLKGGQRGPAITPGNASESLLYQAVSHEGELKMPPAGEALPAEELALLRNWIDQGAPWSDDAGEGTAADSLWWSLKPPKRPAIPEVEHADWVRNPVDSFIMAKLEEKNLKQAPAADKRTLARRVYYDLTGLPPTPEQIDRFVNDSSPDAYRNLIDELLESPQYGERWGRHWLDVVRYADSSGFESDHMFPNAWRYRDYVIKSFNDDKPYDRFVQEQIAGDELWPDRFELEGSRTIPLKKLEYLEARVGTGLYTFGPEILESTQESRQFRNEQLTDWADTTGVAFLGITVGCARCHDHKFDPVAQKDYYGIQAVFANSRPVDVPVISPLAQADYKAAYTLMTALAESRIAYQKFTQAVRDRILDEKKKEYPPEVVAAFEVDFNKRTAEHDQLAAPLTKFSRELKVEEHFTPEEQKRHDQLVEELAKRLVEMPEAEGGNGVKYDGVFQIPKVTVLGHYPEEVVPAVHILDRGSHDQPGQKVDPGVPPGLSQGFDLATPLADATKSRSRKEFALWLTRPDHPLTARVMVNRVWQWHFGKGLVSTPNDFGRMGEAPSHPELLDWLAVEFVEQGWSIKSLHRLILLSNTYQLTSRFNNEENSRIDSENKYLWRMNRKRLEAEALWDTMLSVTGELNLAMGGRPTTTPLTEEEMIGVDSHRWYPLGDVEEYNRRGVYLLVRRNFAFPMFEAFDGANTQISCPERGVTVVAPQALWFLNNTAAFRHAIRFADRLVNEFGDQPAAWVENAWLLALGRRPSEAETEQALELMETLSKREFQDPMWKEWADPARISERQMAGLTKLCLALFNTSEFSFID